VAVVVAVEVDIVRQVECALDTLLALGLLTGG